MDYETSSFSPAMYPMQASYNDLQNFLVHGTFPSPSYGQPGLMQIEINNEVEPLCSNNLTQLFDCQPLSPNYSDTGYNSDSSDQKVFSDFEGSGCYVQNSPTHSFNSRYAMNQDFKQFQCPPNLDIMGDCNSMKLLFNIMDSTTEKLTKVECDNVFANVGQELFQTMCDYVDKDFLDRCNVIVPEESIDNVHYFTRNKDYGFKISYNIESSSKIPVFLYLSLESATPEKQKESVDCVKHHHNILYTCNGFQVQRGSLLKVTLEKDATEMMLNLNFSCNNSCESMFNKPVLKFVFEVGNQKKCIPVLIKVSERSNRDKKAHQSRVGTTADVQIRPTPDIADDLDNIGLNKKILPRLEDFTKYYPDFNIALADENESAHKEFFRQRDKKVSFRVLRGSAIHNQNDLYIRIMAVDKNNIIKTFSCCTKHNRHNDSICHTFRCENYRADYTGSPNGIYMQDRLSIVLRLADIGDEITLKFLCNNSCFIKDKKSMISSLIFSLENSSGQIFANRVFNYKIVERPNRCKYNNTSAIKSSPRRDHSSDESSEPDAKKFKASYA